MGIKQLLKTGFKNHREFLSWLNKERGRQKYTEGFRDFQRLLDFVMEAQWFAKHEIERLRKEGKEPSPMNVRTYMEVGVPFRIRAPGLSVRLIYAPWEKRGLLLDVNPFGPKERAFVQMIILLAEVGIWRWGKCEYCGDYFIAHRTARIQRFCPTKVKGKKSKCSVEYHIKKRSEKTAEQRKAEAAKRQKEYRAHQKRMRELRRKRNLDE